MMKHRVAAAAVLMVGMVVAEGGRADPGVPAPLMRIFQCQAQTLAADRLECFDRETAAARTAIDRHEVVVLDSAQVETTRRSMFGLSDPDQRILRKTVKPAAPFVAVDGTIKSVAEVGYGHYAITLAGGAVWRNVDLLDAPPSVGAGVHISKTPFGAYLLKMPNFQSVHAIRLR